jgi:4-amino-4-deoxy-L-arabinose transferase-like glycosyltransferase
LGTAVIAENARPSRLNVKAVLQVAISALVARVVLSVVRIQYGLGWFPSGDLVWPYGDYSRYASWLQSLNMGLVPYRDFPVGYPPFFVYALYPFYFVSQTFGAAIPIVVSGALTSVLVYLIVDRISTPNVALFAGLVYGLTPLTLLYDGLLWLSIQPMTFFVLLGVYLLLIEKPDLSALAVATAILFRQEALFFLPAYLIWLYKKEGKSMARQLLLILGLVGVVSAPFLLISPSNYFREIFLGYVPRSLAVALPVTNTANTVSAPPVALSPLTLYTLVLAFFSRYLVLALPFLLLPILVSIRKAKEFPLIVLSYSALVLLDVLSNRMFILRYYMLPIFAILFVTAYSREMLAVTAIASVISMLTPEGDFQVVLGFTSLLVMLYLVDSRSRGGHITALSGPGASDAPSLRLVTSYSRSLREKVGL